MSAKTKIWVFHMKELIYTAIFIILGIFLLLLMIFMFSGSTEQETAAEEPSRYTAGIYTASMILGGNPVEIAVTVDEDYISSIEFRQLDETVSAMYPLMEPSWNRCPPRSANPSPWRIFPIRKTASTPP